MADLKAQFEQAVAESRSLPEKPDNMTLLKLYALYKQASSGDAEGKRPGFGDMVVGVLAGAIVLGVVVAAKRVLARKKAPAPTP